MKEKKTSKELVEELKRISPEFLEAAGKMSSEAIEDAVRKLIGNAKMVKERHEIEKALEATKAALKKLQDYVVTRAWANRFGVLVPVLAFAIGALASLVFDLDIIDLLESTVGEKISNALVIGLVPAFFANLYSSMFVSSQFHFLFKERDQIKDPILVRALNLYEPCHPNTIGARIVKAQKISDDIYSRYDEYYDPKDVGRSVKQSAEFEGSYGSKYPIGYGYFVKYKVKPPSKKPLLAKKEAVKQLPS